MPRAVHALGGWMGVQKRKLRHYPVPPCHKRVTLFFSFF